MNGHVIARWEKDIGQSQDLMLDPVVFYPNEEVRDPLAVSNFAISPCPARTRLSIGTVLAWESIHVYRVQVPNISIFIYQEFRIYI